MNIHVIIGEDDCLVSEAAKERLGDGAMLDVVDSANATNADLQLADVARADESVSTPPFLVPKKATWWRNVGFLPGGKASEEVKSALERFARKLASTPLPEGQVFVLSGPHLLKKSVFAKALEGCAEFTFFASEKPWEAARNAVARVSDWAQKDGLVFRPGVADRFVSVVGSDTRSLRNELAKLRDYLGPDVREITAEGVAAVTSAGVGVEPMPWDVTDAVGKRDLAGALAALGRFGGEAGFAVFMTGVLERFFRQMLDVAAGRTDGMSPFAVRKSEGFLRNWTAGELRAARARFVMLRERAVSGLSSADLLVAPTLVRAMRRRAAR